jgi:hypothetical protein
MLREWKSKLIKDIRYGKEKQNYWKNLFGKDKIKLSITIIKKPPQSNEKLILLIK